MPSSLHSPFSVASFNIPPNSSSSNTPSNMLAFTWIIMLTFIVCCNSIYIAFHCSQILLRSTCTNIICCSKKFNNRNIVKSNHALLITLLIIANVFYFLSILFTLLIAISIIFSKSWALSSTIVLVFNTMANSLTIVLFTLLIFDSHSSTNSSKHSSNSDNRKWLTFIGVLLLVISFVIFLTLILLPFSNYALFLLVFCYMWLIFEILILLSIIYFAMRTLFTLNVEYYCLLFNQNSYEMEFENGKNLPSRASIAKTQPIANLSPMQRRITFFTRLTLIIIVSVCISFLIKIYLYLLSPASTFLSSSSLLMIDTTLNSVFLSYAFFNPLSHTISTKICCIADRSLAKCCKMCAVVHYFYSYKSEEKIEYEIIHERKNSIFSQKLKFIQEFKKFSNRFNSQIKEENKYEYETSSEKTISEIEKIADGTISGPGVIVIGSDEKTECSSSVNHRSLIIDEDSFQFNKIIFEESGSESERISSIILSNEMHAIPTETKDGWEQYMRNMLELENFSQYDRKLSTDEHFARRGSVQWFKNIANSNLNWNEMKRKMSIKKIKPVIASNQESTHTNIIIINNNSRDNNNITQYRIPSCARTSVQRVECKGKTICGQTLIFGDQWFICNADCFGIRGKNITKKIRSKNALYEVFAVDIYRVQQKTTFIHHILPQITLDFHLQHLQYLMNSSASENIWLPNILIVNLMVPLPSTKKINSHCGQNLILYCAISEETYERLQRCLISESMALLSKYFERSKDDILQKKRSQLQMKMSVKVKNIAKTSMNFVSGKSIVINESYIHCDIHNNNGQHIFVMDIDGYSAILNSKTHKMRNLWNICHSYLEKCIFDIAFHISAVNAREDQLPEQILLCTTLNRIQLRCMPYLTIVEKVNLMNIVKDNDYKRENYNLILPLKFETSI